MRGILKIQNIPMTPHNPNHNNLPKLLQQLVNSGSFKWRTHVIHMHTWDPASNAIFERFPDLFLGTVNMRDPRDCAVSMAHVHDQPIETACKNIANYHGQLRYFRARTKPLMIRYENLVASKTAYIDQIALHMGFNLTPAQVRQIDGDTTADKAKEVADKVATGKGPIRTVGGRTRVLREHADSFINDRHIQSGKSGRWLTETSDVDQAHLDEILTPIAVSLGYHPSGHEVGKLDA
ncbi:MAG: hypothetical protein ACPGRD_11440 [Planktomarina sp.]